MSRYLLGIAFTILLVPVMVASIYAFPFVINSISAFFEYVATSFAFASDSLDVWGDVFPMDMIKIIMLTALSVVTIGIILRTVQWLTSIFTGSSGRFHD